MLQFDKNYWALILGGSSGFGLAAAKKLARHGMNICVVHRDRRGAMERIETDFDEIRQHAPHFLSFNLDALSPEGRTAVLDQLTEAMKPSGSIRLLFHSIAFGNLKPIAPVPKSPSRENAIQRIGAAVSYEEKNLESTLKTLLAQEVDELHPLVASQYGEECIEEEDMVRTIYSMGTSLLSWVQDIFKRDLFAKDARVLGITSEGNEIAWRGYAAVSAAKAALEAVIRSIAVEFAPYGVRANTIQAGVTDTPALRAIPGSQKMKSVARLRNPFKRLTQPEDVANFIALLCTDEAAWINGALLRVDGGERISTG